MTAPEGFTISQSFLNSIGVGILLAAMALMTTWFWRAKDAAVEKARILAAEHTAVLARLTELEARERASSQVMTPIVTAFQAILVQKLTHLHKPVLDALLVKVGPPTTLTAAEHKELMSELHDRSVDMDPSIGDEERGAAKMLPLVMPMAIAEQAAMDSLPELASLRLMTITTLVGAAPAAVVATVPLGAPRVP
jgi:hypothetical protein